MNAHNLHHSAKNMMEWMEQFINIMFKDMDWWYYLGVVTVKVIGGLFIAAIISFPIQVKYQAPEATYGEIFIVLWDCIVNVFE